jgi:hypothetical protein
MKAIKFVWNICNHLQDYLENGGSKFLRNVSNHHLHPDDGDKFLLNIRNQLQDQDGHFHLRESQISEPHTKTIEIFSVA